MRTVMLLVVGVANLVAGYMTHGFTMLLHLGLAALLFDRALSRLEVLVIQVNYSNEDKPDDQ
jgi:hypothetical protein